jgi:hypothetical protein
MKLRFLFVLFFAAMTTVFAQQLSYKNGKIYNSDNVKIHSSEIKQLLGSQPKLLEQYNAGKTKANVGGFLLGLGGGLIIADVLTGLTQDKVYPGTTTYIGIAAAVISIPIIMGHNKKIKNAIDGYNASLATKSTSFNVEKLNILSNKNGIGMQITF